MSSAARIASRSRASEPTGGPSSAARQGGEQVGGEDQRLPVDVEAPG